MSYENLVYIIRNENEIRYSIIFDVKSKLKIHTLTA